MQDGGFQGGRVRMRPRADKGVSRTNASSVTGGLFGREPASYSQYRMPNAVAGPFAGDMDDFMARLEQAEARDTGYNKVSGYMPDASNQTLSTHEEQQAMRDRNRNRNWQGSIFLGDDSTAAQRKTPDKMYQTTKMSEQIAMQEGLRNALTRQQERTLIDIMIEQHGMTEAEARYEIELYNKEEAAKDAEKYASRPTEPQGYAAKQAFQPQPEAWRRQQPPKQQQAQPQRPPPPQQQMPEFVPSATFAGAQPGYSFKNGPHGVGYYRDGRVAMQPPPPQQQNLQHHYPPPQQQQQFPPQQQQQQYNTLGRRDLPPTMQGGRVPVQANERMVPDRPGTRGGMRVNAPSMQGGLFAKGVWS